MIECIKNYITRSNRIKEEQMIDYSISYNKNMDCFILWKEYYSKHGYGFLGIYHGSKTECQKLMQEKKEELNKCRKNHLRKLKK